MNSIPELLQSVVTEIFRMSWQGSLRIVIVLMATTAARGWIEPTRTRCLVLLKSQTRSWKRFSIESRSIVGRFSNLSLCRITSTCS